jgi:hypothetical protein
MKRKRRYAMLRWFVACVLVVGVLSGAVTTQKMAIAPITGDLDNGHQRVYYTGPWVKILGNDTLTVALVNTRDYQANGPTPTRLWAVPENCGIYATLFSRNPSDLRWNFYEFDTDSFTGAKSWFYSDTGAYAYESGGYGNMVVNYYPNDYRYSAFWSAHEYVTGEYWPDVWGLTGLSTCPFSWDGSYFYLQGETSNRLWPRIGFTQSGYLHQITTDGDNYYIIYNRVSDLANPFWFGDVEIVSTEDGPWYAFYSDPFSKVVVVTYCRTSSDNHIVMLIDTLEGDMFYAGTPIEIDLSAELSSVDPLSIGFVGDGTPFVDRDGNIHHFLFGSNGATVVPLHIWHFFYDLKADTMHWTMVEALDDTLIQASVGINTLWAGRAQLGQNWETGNLYAIWEEFCYGDNRFAVSSTGDTFPPTQILLGMSTDNGLNWSIETLAVSDVDFGNVWARFPVISPIIPSIIPSIYSPTDTMDGVVYGFHVDYDPGFTWQGQGEDTTQVLWVNVSQGQVGVKESPTVASNLKIDLWSNVNPVNSEAILYLKTNRDADVNLTVYDRTGRKVRTLASGNAKAGITTVRWDLKDDRGKAVSSGVYFCILTAEGKSRSLKLLVER